MRANFFKIRLLDFASGSLLLAALLKPSGFSRSAVHSRFTHSVRFHLTSVLRKIRCLEIPSGSFLEFRFKISFSRNFSASLVTRLGALRSGFAFTFVLRNFASWILLAAQAEQLHFKSTCALFPFRSAFALAGFVHFVHIHPTKIRSLGFCWSFAFWHSAPNSLFKEFCATLKLRTRRTSGFALRATQNPLIHSNNFLNRFFCKVK